MVKLSVFNADVPSAVGDRLEASPTVAVDIETTGLDAKHSEIALVQVFDGTSAYLVKPQVGRIPRRLCSLMQSKKVTKIFHHAPFDLSFMMWHWGVSPARVACTKVAAKILYPGLPATEYSLKSLLRSHLGVQISKEMQVSNWSSDFLSSEQISYAVRDVLYLRQLNDRLMDDAVRLGLRAAVERSWDFIPTRVELDLREVKGLFEH